MNCETAIERLPWLLNGTLDPSEREEVLRHLKDCESCRQALVETREAWQIFDLHLPAKVLVALAYDETPPGMTPQEVAQHLATCARCAADLELARTSRHLEAEENLLPFAPRRKKEEPVPASAPHGSRRWQASALAAGLAGVIGLAGWIQTGRQVQNLRDQLATRGASAASAGPMVISTADPVVLDPFEVRQRGAEEAELTVPPVAGSALQLNGDAAIEPAARAAINAYRVEVWQSGGAKLGETGVRYLPNGNYALTVQGLAAGRYELRVFGRGADGERPFESYRLKVAG